MKRMAVAYIPMARRIIPFLVSLGMKKSIYRKIKASMEL
jgi:hypothetical protein